MDQSLKHMSPWRHSHSNHHSCVLGTSDIDTYRPYVRGASSQHREIQELEGEMWQVLLEHRIDCPGGLRGSVWSEPWWCLRNNCSKKHSEDFYFYVYACVYMCLCLYMCMWVPMEVKKDVRSPEDGVIGGCECPDMGAGNQAMMPFKNSKHS